MFPSWLFFSQHLKHSQFSLSQCWCFAVCCLLFTVSPPVILLLQALLSSCCRYRYLRMAPLLVICVLHTAWQIHLTSIYCFSSSSSTSPPHLIYTSLSITHTVYAHPILLSTVSSSPKHTFTHPINQTKKDTPYIATVPYSWSDRIGIIISTQNPVYTCGNWLIETKHAISNSFYYILELFLTLSWRTLFLVGPRMTCYSFIVL